MTNAPGNRHENHRQVRDSGADRGVAPDLLHEDRHEEEHPEDRGADAEADQVRPGPVAGREHPGRHQRMPRPCLDEPECHEEHHGGDE